MLNKKRAPIFPELQTTLVFFEDAKTSLVATDGLAPSKGIARLIYSQLPLLLGTSRHIVSDDRIRTCEGSLLYR